MEEQATPAEVWGARKSWAWKKTAHDKYGELNSQISGANAQLLFCALAAITDRLDLIAKRLTYVDDLAKRLLVPYAEKEEARRQALRTAVHETISASEKLHGPLNARVRHEWSTWLYERNRWQLGGILWEERLAWDDSFVPAEQGAFSIKLIRPHRWTKRSKRWKILDAWMKRRPRRLKP